MNSPQTEEIPDAAFNASQPYTAGTLRYDRRGVIRLFAWLLWGDFAFTFFESIFGRFMPLYLKDLNASNALIGIMTGSIAGLVNILFLPNISQWSDRLRGRLGRRIPFLLAVTPITVASLIFIGFAPEVGQWLHHHITASLFPRLTCEMLVISLLCFFVVLYHFFNMVLVNSYNWLLRDVVPQMLMARFISWFRIVGTVGSFLFLWYIFPTMISHRQVTFLGVSLFYLLSFLLMCWKVKEGDYPEPPPHDSSANVLATFGTYFRDCLSVALYRNFFVAYVLVTMATTCAGSFTVLYVRHSLGLGMDDIGRISAYLAFISAGVYILMAWVCEKITAMRVGLISLPLLVAGSVAGYFFIVDQQSWFLCSLIAGIPAVGWALGSLAISMQLFPSQSFAQFSSGMNVFGCGGLILGNFLIGVLMDFTGSNYRMVFLWSAAFFAMAIVPMLRVFRDWKRHGGPDCYVPPLIRDASTPLPQKSSP